MKHFTRLFQKRVHIFVAPALLFLLASCGSYQYAGYEDDGIYSDGNRETSYEENQYNDVEESNSEYYEDFFAEKSAQYENIPTEGAIFTDIESYSSQSNYQGEEVYEDENYDSESYGPWGSESNSVSINYYADYSYPRFYYPGWIGGWDYGYGYNPYWGGYHNSFGWNFGFGYHHYYNGFYPPYYYGYGYGYNPYYYGYNSNYPFYYNRRNVAYNAGRRNTYVNDYHVSEGRSSYLRNTSDNTILRNRQGNRDNNYGLTRNNRDRDRDSRSIRVEVNDNERSGRNRTFRSSRSERENRSYSPSRRNSNNNVQRSSTRRSSSYSNDSFGGGRSSGSIRSSSSGSRGRGR